MLVLSENKFFGQLERFSNEDLQNLQCELLGVYKALSNPPLLYADVKSHIGDCAVVRFSVDGAYYRAKVCELNRIFVIFLCEVCDTSMLPFH